MRKNRDPEGPTGIGSKGQGPVVQVQGRREQVVSQRQAEQRPDHRGGLGAGGEGVTGRTATACSSSGACAKQEMAEFERRWLPAREAMAMLRHESQRWAVAEACRMTPVASDVVRRRCFPGIIETCPDDRARWAGCQTAGVDPMGHRTLILRRPVRAAATVGGVVALVGCGAALVPGVTSPLVFAPFALGYGAILGWFVVGLVLASRLPATRRWWIGSRCLSHPWRLSPSGRLWPASLLRWWWVIGGVSLVIIASWLSAGCLLALLGWWLYARHGRSDAA